MTQSELNEIEKVERDYVDDKSIKEIMINDVMPKYYPDDELDHLTVGLEGMIGEYAGTIAEDGFNAASTLLMETFPTRAKMKNSIYSNAAVFQLSNVFATHSRCDFLLVLSEEDVIRNFINKQGDPYNYFYIDKDTTVFIEEIPFVLDYDIVIRAIYKQTPTPGYVYSAKYNMDDYKNSISPIDDPYVQIRKTSNGLLVLQVNMGQYRRNVIYEQIIDNAMINYSTVNVAYTDSICGMDVLYKEPGDPDYNTHLGLQVRFSQPSKSPFCYYRKKDDGLIELSFTTKDTYFQPKFNSELKIITYSTLCEEGSFDKYEGENISLIKNNDNYHYDYSWAVSVRTLSSSVGGKSPLDDEALQDLTVEAYSTATELSTDHDLQIYFNNYKHRYGAEVLFLKKRDDPANRIHSAFLYIKNNDYFYPTNTLTLSTNLMNFDEKENKTFYNLDPGYLFTYKYIDGYQVLPVYYSKYSSRDYYDNIGEMYALYENGEETNTLISRETILDKVSTGELRENKSIEGKYDFKDGSGNYYLSKGIMYDHVDEDGVSYREDLLPQEIILNQVLSGELFIDNSNGDAYRLQLGNYYKFEGETTFARINSFGNLEDTNYLTKEEVDAKVDSGELVIKENYPNRYYLEDNTYYKETKKYMFYDETDTMTNDFIVDEVLNDKIVSDEIFKNPEQCYRLVNSNYVLFNEDGTRVDTSTVYRDPIVLTETEMMMKYREGKVKYIQLENEDGFRIDFLFDVEKEQELKVEYLDYYETYKELNGLDDDFTMSEYIYDFTFNEFKEMKSLQTGNIIDNRATVFDENVEEIVENHSFVFTNHLLMTIAKQHGLIEFYNTTQSQDSTLDFVDQNDADAFIQFITYTLHMNRDMSEEKKYHFSLNILPSVSMELDHEKIVAPETIYDTDIPQQFLNDSNRTLSTYNKEQLSKNAVRVVLSFHDKEEGMMQGYMELIPTEYNLTKDQITFEADFFTDDLVTTNQLFRPTHYCPYCGNHVTNSVNTVNERYVHDYTCMNPIHGEEGKRFSEGIINVRESDDVWIPIKDSLVKVNILFRDPELGTNNPTNNEFVKYDTSFENYHWTNIYSTINEPLNFINPMSMINSNIEYHDFHNIGVDALDCSIYDIPMLKWSLIAYQNEGPDVTDDIIAEDVQKFQYFMKSYLNHYDILSEAEELLRNNTSIDTKFYNTYGRSTNFTIGEDGELIDTVNIRIYFDIWLTTNTDQIYAENNLKIFIKEYIESINNEGTNDLYISNLIRAIENNFAFVHHLKFKGINDYDTSYQAIKNRSIKLENLSKEERRHFVPDLLTINKSNIYLSFFEIS